MSVQDFFTNEAGEVVESQMAYLTQKADESLVSMNDALDDLKKLIVQATPPAKNISYAYVNENIEASIPGSKPDTPNFPSVSGIEKPVSRDIATIDIPDFPTIPAFDGGDPPTDTFEWHESIDDYQSDLLTAIKSSLLDWITNGGTGLSATVEAAIYARARARLEEERELAYNAKEEEHTPSGFFVPTGSKNADLRMINIEFDRKLLDLNQEIMKSQADLAQNNTQFAHTLSVQLENNLQTFFNDVMNRLFTAAKETVSFLYEIYKQRVEVYVAILNGKKTEIDAKTSIVTAQATINKDIIESNIGEIERYKAEINAVVSVIDGMAKVYAAQLKGYDSDITLEKANVDARVERLRALVSQSMNETELELKEAEINLTAFIQSLGLNIEVAKTIAGILSNIAAGALSGLNTQASISDSTGRKYDRNENETTATYYNHQIKGY